jgi:Protein of unknown function (DUF3833)
MARRLLKQPLFLTDPSSVSRVTVCMKKILSRLIVLLLPLAIMGCASTKLAQFDDKQPKLVLEDYFIGQTEATGVFEDRFTKLRRQFVVQITGSVDGNVLTLDERFVYDDGEKQQRIWKLTRTSPTTYEGRAGDVKGVAKGILNGNAFNFQYDIDLKVGVKKDGTAKTWKVHFNDWMFLQPNGVVINRAYVTRFGFDVGSVTIAFHKK